MRGFLRKSRRAYGRTYIRKDKREPTGVRDSSRPKSKKVFQPLLVQNVQEMLIWEILRSQNLVIINANVEKALD